MNNRTENVSIRMTSEELADLKAEAAKEGLPVGAVIRRRLFHAPATDQAVITEVRMPDARPGSWAARNPKQAAIDQLLKKPGKDKS